jgi:hypothetical protein
VPGHDVLSNFWALSLEFHTRMHITRQVSGSRVSFLRMRMKESDECP